MSELFQTFILEPVFNLLLVLYSLVPGGDFGIAIVLFTILIRWAMYPLLKKQLHQTTLMRKLQPQLARVKKAAKGNRQLEAMQQMELYKKYGVKPFSSIGIILIQLPIFLALYQVIQVMTLHRDRVASHAYDFVQHLEPVRHIVENPDRFNQYALGFIDITHTAVNQQGIDIALFVLAIIAGATQYFIGKQIMPATEKKRTIRQIMADAADGKQADAADMNTAVASNMMKIMPFFMFFIMINLPGALALYYVVSNIIQMIQQSHILKQDEIELNQIADEVEPEVKTPAKKATAKARERAAREAKVTRIVAKDTGRRKEKKK